MNKVYCYCYNTLNMKTVHLQYSGHENSTLTINTLIMKIVHLQYSELENSTLTVFWHDLDR